MAHTLADDIRQGRYLPGSKIPSIRSLSRRLKVSISTITQAYTLLEDQGFVNSRPQSGYFVRDNIQTHTPPISRGTEPKPVTKLDIICRLLEGAKDKNLINLGSAMADNSFLPFRALQTHAQKVMRFSRDDAFTFSLPPGLLDLRQIISQRMLDANVRSHADDIIITTGATQALDLCLRTCTQPNDIIALESPCYYGYLRMASQLNLKVVEIPTDPNEGISFDALKLALQQWPIKAIVLSSRFSNPTAALIPKEKQKQLYDLVCSHKVPLIEDDVYGELGYATTPYGTIKQFDKKGLIMFCSSYTKTLSSGLRVGWCLPGRYYDQVLETQQCGTWGISSMAQLTLESYLRQGHYDKHLRQLRSMTEENTFRVANFLKNSFSGESLVSTPKGSFLLWFCMPQNINVDKVQKYALERGINLAPGSLFSNTSHFDSYLRINCALPWKEKLEPALIKLVNCIREAEID